jgi:hypothetical protein
MSLDEKKGFLAAFDTPSRIALSMTYLKRLLAVGSKKWPIPSSSSSGRLSCVVYVSTHAHSLYSLCSLSLSLSLSVSTKGEPKLELSLFKQGTNGKGADDSSSVDKLRTRLESAGIPTVRFHDVRLSFEMNVNSSLTRV